MPPFDAGVPSLVLRLDRNPFHHGTLGAVRSLGRAGVEVHAVVESAASPVVRSRYLRRAHPVAPGAVRPDGTGFTELLVRVSERIGRPAVLIPMDDLGAILAAAHAPRLGGRYLLPAQAPGLPDVLADKSALAEVCERAGIPHPPTVVPGSAAAAAAAAGTLGLPLIAKWSRPWLLPPGAGLRSTTLIRSPGAARSLYERGAGSGAGLLLQRHLPDGPDADWFFHGCFGGDGRLLAGGTGRKELAWPPRAGLTAKGRWHPNPAVTAIALRLAEHIGYRGVIDLDLRRDRSCGTYRLLDANPRPGAQFRLFTAPDGTDVVRALYRDLTGRPPAPAAERPGRVFIAENYALLSVLAARPATRGRPATGSARGSLVETAWFAGDDPLPFAAMAGAWLGRGPAKGVRWARSVLHRS
ncbi:ATP-grasp domain-containing protein [Streptomyces qinzhouensis]|uniref:ATP-grasp domain-containing protein n=1 Tax=Streptomyces qinzhouensis TaxID=2599401 RepID=A0A5B8IMM2_9ACTN|nr:ATP-grasp domain-containing protein [Streptomyces qinzhouensis]QDY78749.1 ATP-grasp domain-containing protein [Streptomyces qinzhouensis]